MKKILVVEDDRFIANAYRIKMVKAGFEVKMAMDGDEALEALTTFIPDIILLDLILPKIDGFSVLEEIKKSDTYKNIPVVVTSNLGQQEDINRAMSLGAVDYVIKSDITLENLIAKVNNVLRGN